MATWHYIDAHFIPLYILSISSERGFNGQKVGDSHVIVDRARFSKTP